MSKLLKIQFLRTISATVSWLGVLRPPTAMTSNWTWFLPNRSGTLLVDTQTAPIPWVQRFEYNTVGSGVFKNVPTDALYMNGWLIGGGGGSGSGARGNTNANRTGGGSGSAGGRTPFLFSLKDLATRFGCTVADLQYSETVGNGGTPGAAVLINDTDGNNGSSGGTTYLRMRAAPGTGDSNPQFICRAVGGSPGSGGRRGVNTTAGGGGITSLGATFPGQAGQQGRNAVGNGGGAINNAAAAGGGGGGAAANFTLAALGGSSGPACYDQAGDLAGTTVAGTLFLPGSALTVLPAGIPGSGGSGGAYPGAVPGGPGGPGGAGFRGGSGGGGGASDNGFPSGAGGPSGNGHIVIDFSPYPM